MAKQPPALSMSQIIACDAPLLSPVSMGDHQWDAVFSPSTDNFTYPYYNLPPSPPTSVGSSDSDSPVPATKMLKMRIPQDTAQEQISLCMPTHQVFDLSEPTNVHAPPSPAPSLLSAQALPPVSAIDPTASKRSASPTPGVSKKRAIGERISSKDFIPPDVSGLSKREARLVKNRAAAFLSRQRKREEFETMEVRVAELEQENARLLALTKSGNACTAPATPSEDGLVSEVELLRAQLAAARERERELSAKLGGNHPTQHDLPIKVEASESYVPTSPARSSPVPSPHKTAASLGLMVLLCALPTLLSMPMQSAAPTSFSIPSPFPTSINYDYTNNFLPNDYDWSRATGSSLMDMDSDERNRFSTAAASTRKLEFAGVDSNELGDLGGLDISFDTSSADNGKIRVRIHPSSSASSRAGSPGASYSKPETTSAMDLWSSESESTYRSSFSSQSSSSSLSPSSSDPFLGIDYGGMPFSSDMYRMNDLDDGTLSDFGLGSEYSVPDSTTGGKRRVRIALKSPPAAGGEGGEWEVQIC